MKITQKAMIGLIIGFAICLGIGFLAGENPVHLFLVLFKSAFGSRYDLGLTLFYTSSLIFTGLSVCIAFHAGLFNIGAEGQMTIGCLATTGFALAFPQLPVWLAIPSATLAGFLAGSLWGFIPGWLKVNRSSHEVIVTMMMNFIAAALVNFVIFEFIRSETSQNPESAEIPSQYLLTSIDPIQKIFIDSPANISFAVALISCFLVYIFLYKSVWGYELRASGSNPTASSMMGIASDRWKILAMTLAGMVASLVAINEILGSAGKFKIGFSAEYGFIGIAVSILARNHPIGIIATAFLFGVLQKGAADLDIETEMITRDFAKVIQGILILSVTAAMAFEFKRKQKKS